MQEEQGMISEEAQPVPEPQIEPEPQPEPRPAEPTRVSRFFSSLLRWALGVVVVFALGVLATWLTQVQPKAEALRDLQLQLDSAERSLASLETELDRLRGVEAEKLALETELEQAHGRLDLLGVLVDVTSAQLAIAQEEPIKAKAALAETDPKLQDLQGRLSGDEADTVAGLRDRLSLVQDEVESDVFAAQRDLEILANRLLELDRELFGE